MASPATVVFHNEVQSVRLEVVSEPDRQSIEFPRGPSQQQEFHMGTSLSSPLSPYWPPWRESPRESGPELLSQAELRLQALQALISEARDDEEPQQPLSDFAVRTTLNVIRELALSAAISRVGIFPTPLGGVALQTVGPRRTVSVEIPAGDGLEMRAKYSEHDVYHRETVRTCAAAANFLITNTR